MDFRPLDGAPYHGHIKTKFTYSITASRRLVLEYTFFLVDAWFVLFYSIAFSVLQENLNILNVYGISL